MNPLEAGGEHLIDLDGADFIGRDALLRVREAGPSRHTVGLLMDGVLPRLEWNWPVTAAGGRTGVVRWAAYSFALGRSVASALVDADIEIGETVQVDHPLGVVDATVTTLPFVDS